MGNSLSGSNGRNARGDLFSKQLAQQKYLEARAAGSTNREAMAAARRDLKSLEYWRKSDPEFRAKADAVSSALRDERATEPRDVDFATFCERYFGQRVFWHQLQWIDILEGRAPRDLHPAQSYEPANPNRLLVNTPVHHAKSSTITVNYVLYRLAMDPNVRVKIVSKTQNKAREFLYAIKTRLTHPQYAAFQRDFGPQGGWKETADAWRADWVYLGGEDRTPGQKDPTLEALGIGGQIYGSRANLIVLDDCIVGANAHEWEKQLSWLNREVGSRLGRTGKLLVVGTRIAPVDLYRELRNGDNFPTGKSPWTYFSQPAVLEYADEPKDWRTLWPLSNQPIEEGSVDEEPNADGMWPAWDGPALAEVRANITEADWAMIYQQADVTTDSVFAAHAVKGSRGTRGTGPMVAGTAGHRPRGMDGLLVIGAMDPSGSKQSAFVVYAVDRETKKRYVLDCRTLSPWSWTQVAELVEDWTDRYDISEWVSEKNMYHASLRHNERITLFLQNRGVRMVEHYTGSNKLDVNTGVMSLAPLFGEWARADDSARWTAVTEPLIELPRKSQNRHVLSLVDQLVTWSPDTKNPTDLVMALWFAELRVREVVSARNAGRSNFAPNRFASPRRVARRGVVDLRDYAHQRGA